MQAKLRRGARAVARSQRGFRTPQVESTVPLGPLDLGKMRLGQTREMRNRLHDDLRVSRKDVERDLRPRSPGDNCRAVYGKRAVHYEGDSASPWFGSDAFFLGQVVQGKWLIPPATF